MRVYLKSGQTVKVSKKDGRDLINELWKDDEGNMRGILNKKPRYFFRLDEIVAIK